MPQTALDLFSGAGGFSLAAHNANLEVAAAIENDQSAARTYRENIVKNISPKSRLLNEDIFKVSPQSLIKELNIDAGELTIMLGGPPCQGFSSHRLKDSGVNDPRNNLLIRYFDFVNAFLPKSFLVENVSGLFWERHGKYLKSFLDLADKSGYKIVFCGNLNAKDYGVPQNRKRAFIVGIRKDLDFADENFPPRKTHFSPTSQQVRSGFPSWNTASCVFEPPTGQIKSRFVSEYFMKKLDFTKDQAWEFLNTLTFGSEVPEDDPCNVHMLPSARMIERFKSTPLNGSRTDAGADFELNCHSNGYQGHKDVYGRMLIHQPANTITTGCNNPSKGRFVHPWKNNGITLRHAARLQSFPDNFVFMGSSTQKARQIGNAVPPVFAEYLIRSIVQNI